MKKFKEYLGEAFFKVKIPEIAPTFVEAGSASEVKANMRKIMKPDVVKELEIERVTPAVMKKMLHIRMEKLLDLKPNLKIEEE